MSVILIANEILIVLKQTITILKNLIHKIYLAPPCPHIYNLYEYALCCWLQGTCQTMSSCHAMCYKILIFHSAIINDPIKYPTLQSNKCVCPILKIKRTIKTILSTITRIIIYFGHRHFISCFFFVLFVLLHKKKVLFDGSPMRWLLYHLYTKYN